MTKDEKHAIRKEYKMYSTYRTEELKPSDSEFERWYFIQGNRILFLRNHIYYKNNYTLTIYNRKDKRILERYSGSLKEMFKTSAIWLSDTCRFMGYSGTWY